MRAIRFILAVHALVCAMGCSAGRLDEPGVAASGLTQEMNFGTNPGNLAMYVYAPASMPPSAPLVIVLHGCSQTAADYVNAGWDAFADIAKFYVVYAETAAAGGCFGWLSSADNTRDSGQALSIKQMVDDMKQKHSIDGNRVYVTGLSAGGAMTAVMLATYPDVFAAGATMAGVAYGANIGETKTAMALGDSVRAAYPAYHGPWPRVSVWQGQSDSVVAPSSATALVSQWANVHGLSGTATAMNTVEGAAHASYANAQGEVVVESYLIPNMAHGTALHVPFAPAGGCGQVGSYLLEAGICSTYHAGVFFGLQQAPTSGDGGSASPDFGSTGGGGGAGGGGGGGGGTGGGGATGGGGGASGSPSPARGGGGCAIAGTPDGAGWPAMLLLLGLIVAINRRKRCAERPAPF